MTQNTKTQKTQKVHTRVFVQNCKKNRNGNIYVFCHNFWSNQNVDLLSTSKWPSEPQFCERWTYIWQKMVRNGRTKAIYKGTFISIQTLHTMFSQHKWSNLHEWRNQYEFFWIWLKQISQSTEVYKPRKIPGM